MIQGKHDRLVVHDMEGMTELSRIADAGHLSQIMSVHLQELHEVPGALVGKAEHHPVLHAVLGRIPRDAP